MWMRQLHIFTIAIFVIFVQCSFINGKLFEILDRNQVPEDAILNFTGLATKYGHPPVQYTVITEDNYILTLYRLKGRSMYPILLMHGLYDSSDGYVIRGNTSLGITLANDGYDVWIGNFRGNRYSRKHVFLNPDDDTEYWNFSFHEMGYYDLPAIIDTILKETKTSKLSAIAHSQGTTAFFVLGSVRSDYNSKINIMMALAPVCYLQNTRHPISTFVKISPFLEKMAHVLNVDEVLGDSSTFRNVLRTICSKPITGYVLCAIGIIFELCGYDLTELEPSFHPILTAHLPAGGSVMSMIHFLQIGRTKIFARYDYGIEQNMVVYNSSTPPPYTLENVIMPVALFTARNDRLSTLKDVSILREQLPNVVYYLLNPRFLFNHADYVIGRRMNNYLFPYIYDVLEKYNGFK